MIQPTALSALERRAAFVAAAEMRNTAKTTAATKHLGVTWTHLLACLNGERVPSEALRERVAEYVGIPADTFWGERTRSTAAA